MPLIAVKFSAPHEPVDVKAPGRSMHYTITSAASSRSTSRPNT